MQLYNLTDSSNGSRLDAEPQQNSRVSEPIIFRTTRQPEVADE
ncbi:MAG: hypothetical protein A07HR60_02892 [uncultured archaeon A07HR60]|jgi:hypothetical protein|nr:MAG: hypothetical protein A07HR60_02892 [uncultured archaeon A07HR60]